MRKRSASDADNNEGSASKKSKRKEGKDDPDRPVRPRTAYNFFFRSERQKLMGIDDGCSDPTQLGSTVKKRRRHRKGAHALGFRKLTEHVGKKWKELDPASKSFFENLAQRDMKRYKEECARWEEEKERRKQNQGQADGGSVDGSSGCTESGDGNLNNQDANCPPGQQADPRMGPSQVPPSVVPLQMDQGGPVPMHPNQMHPQMYPFPPMNPGHMPPHMGPMRGPPHYFHNMGPPHMHPNGMRMGMNPAYCNNFMPPHVMSRGVAPGPSYHNGMPPPMNSGMMFPSNPNGAVPQSPAMDLQPRPDSAGNMSASQEEVDGMASKPESTAEASGETEKECCGESNSTPPLSPEMAPQPERCVVSPTVLPNDPGACVSREEKEKPTINTDKPIVSPRTDDEDSPGMASADPGSCFRDPGSVYRDVKLNENDVFIGSKDRVAPDTSSLQLPVITLKTTQDAAMVEPDCTDASASKDDTSDSVEAKAKDDSEVSTSAALKQFEVLTTSMAGKLSASELSAILTMTEGLR